MVVSGRPIINEGQLLFVDLGMTQPDSSLAWAAHKLTTMAYTATAYAVVVTVESKTRQDYKYNRTVTGRRVVITRTSIFIGP